MGVNFGNLDLLSLGTSAAGMLILGFIAFLSDPKSVSNRIFLGLAVVASCWGFINYASYQPSSAEISFWLLRLVMFFGIWASFFAFALAYIFPGRDAAFPKYFTRIISPATALVAFSSLTPFVFGGIAQVAGNHVTQIINGPGIIFFGIFVFFLNIGGVVLLLMRVRKTSGEERRAMQFFLAGFMAMLVLIVLFNFIFPAFFNNTRFIPLGGLFLFPFIALTAYAILRHHLLNIKVIATEMLAFILSVVSLSEVILAGNLGETIFRTAVFLLTLLFSLLLIRSVIREVRQREELERLDKELEEKNRQLEDLSRFKSQLLSLASHQIRSPLAAMKGFLTLIVTGSYGPVSDKIRETLGKVGLQADELIGLINTLLDVRKVEEGKMEYQFAKTDLVKIVRDVFEILKSLAQGKGLEFSFTPPAHEVWVNADAEKLKQVVQNLTDNAIKYTPGGFVHLELKEENGAAMVSVADSGLGVSPTLLPYLFEEFVRDERVKKEIRGTGLGLYIARKIAEAHGGKLWAESPGEGKGSIFRMSVPLLAGEQSGKVQ